jgi:hypothetical protein
MNPIKAANPINLTKGAIGLTGTAVGLAGTTVRTTAHLLLSVLDQLGQEAEQDTGAARRRSARSTGLADDASIPGPTVVPVEPHAPAEPPIDVVGEALAAEAAAAPGERSDDPGLAHEPRGASRDEEHGDAALQRAEMDEITMEAAAALEGDVEPE